MLNAKKVYNKMGPVGREVGAEHIDCDLSLFSPDRVSHWGGAGGASVTLILFTWLVSKRQKEFHPEKSSQRRKRLKWKSEAVLGALVQATIVDEIYRHNKGRVDATL